MEGLVSVTLEIMAWILCNILEMNYVSPLLSRLMFERFDNYNEERKKEVLLKFTSFLHVLKIAYSIIAFFILTDDKLRESHNLWGYFHFYQRILVMIVSYCLADILMQLIWKVKRKPWQYLHHIYGIGIGGFVILINITFLSSASFNLTPDVFAPFTGLLAFIGFGMNDNKYFRGYTFVSLGAYVIFQASSIPSNYYQFFFKEHDLDEESIICYIFGGMVLDCSTFYSFVVICYIYYINSSTKENSPKKESQDLKFQAPGSRSIVKGG
ncbi:uncharacterized protein LOC143449761 [Clavelina lepadiformis]|uniref:uncharacterized protein LOC143449761 n=1 Tax=Clavelina lepadiformis TaxID=159417 RepID=UPI004042E840